MAAGDLRDRGAGVRGRLPRAQGLPRRRWPPTCLRARGRARRAPSSSTSSRRAAPTSTRSASRARSTIRRSAREVDRSRWPGASGPASASAFPAVLGMRDPHGVWSELEHRLGRPVFEIPTLPPSVPGMRVAPDPARGAAPRGRPRDPRTRWSSAPITTAAGSRAARARGPARGAHGADWVVLATGGFATGGLALDSRWVGARDGARPAGRGRPGAGRGALRARVLRRASAGAAPAWRSTRELRPSTRDGERVYENVLVAGATLAGAEPWREKSGDGLSLADGLPRRRAARGDDTRRRRPPAQGGADRWRSETTCSAT